MTDKINKYLDNGSLVGPYFPHEVPFRSYHLSPTTGLWKRKPNKVTLIQNLSAPIGDSINSIIPDYLRSTTYPTFEYIIEIAFAVGPGGYLSTIDLKDSYFILPILERFIKLFGSDWFGKIIFYACLPFGLATAPALFNLFADILENILIEYNVGLYFINAVKVLTHYLDDFFFGHHDYQKALKQFNRLKKLLIKLGIPTSDDKMTPPSQIIIILGFLLDTIKQTVTIPPHKLQQYIADIKWLLHKNNKYKCTVKKLEKIGGKLRHCARAMYGGAAFVRGIESTKHYMQFIRKVPDNLKFKLGKRARYDLEFWLEILPKMTYSTPFWYILKDKRQPDIIIYTDACENNDTKAYGGIDTLGHWFAQDFTQTKFQQVIKTGKKLINVMELMAIVVGITIHKDIYANKSILIRCDNEVAIEWLMTQRAKFTAMTEKLVCVMLKNIFQTLITNKIYIQAKYIKSKDNTFADNLSRLHPTPFNDIQLDLLNWQPLQNPTNTNNIVDKVLLQYNTEFGCNVIL